MSFILFFKTLLYVEAKPPSIKMTLSFFKEIKMQSPFEAGKNSIFNILSLLYKATYNLTKLNLHFYNFRNKRTVYQLNF